MSNLPCALNFFSSGVAMQF